VIEGQLKRPLDHRELVRIGIERGWIRKVSRPMSDIEVARAQGRIASENARRRKNKPLVQRAPVTREEKLLRQRLCSARLRAERMGLDTSKFPSRVRKPPQRKSKTNGLQ